MQDLKEKKMMYVLCIHSTRSGVGPSGVGPSGVGPSSVGPSGVGPSGVGSE